MVHGMKKYIFNISVFLLILLTNLFAQNKSDIGNYIFEPIEGKIIGIWPHENKNNSVEKLKQLREQWGFNYILIAAPYGEPFYSNVRNAGFDSLHIMKQIYLPDLINRKDWFWNNIETLGKIWAYYFDEPISREFSFSVMMGLLSNLSSKGFYPNAKFVVGEIDERKAERFLKTTDAIMYSGYGSREKQGLDQIQSWQEWKQYLGEKFSMLWISTNEDSLEYRTLFKAAKDQGLDAIWLYQYEPMDPDKETSFINLEKFCDAAVEFGFMRVKEKK